MDAEVEVKLLKFFEKKQFMSVDELKVILWGFG